MSYCADTISIVEFAKGHDSVKNIGGVMVFILCMSFDDALYVYICIYVYTCRHPCDAISSHKC